MDDEPVWQSEEWKNARAELLAEKCQQCSSTETLSLVHLWKPPRYSVLRQKVESQLLNEMIEAGNIQSFDPSASEEERMSCPECQSISLRSRKTKRPRYKCGRCMAEFDNAIAIVVRDDFLYNQLYRTWKTQQLGEEQEELIETKIKTLQQQYDAEYRSGKGTTTMCRKCAFLWTQKQMQLCTTCKTRYHKRRYDQCYECYQQSDLVLCEKCQKNRIVPQPGGINICESCYEKMWDELTE